MGAEAFGARERIRRQSDFQAARREGRRVEGRHFLLHVRPTGGGRRLGITVSRAVGIATVRNRVKRIVREVYRRERGALPDGIDVVVIARRPAAAIAYAAARDELCALFRRAHPGRGTPR